MKIFSLFIALIALQLGGCAAFSKSGEPSDAAPERLSPEALIASDFVSAVSQLASMPAHTTTIELLQPARNDAFTLAMEGALDNAGYGTRWVADSVSGSFFQYRKDRKNAAAAAHEDVYELAFGKVELRRSYVTDAQQRVRVNSPLYVRGADARNVVLNDDLIAQANALSGTVALKLAPNPEPDSQNLQAARVHAVPLERATQISTTPTNSLGLQNSSSLRVPSDANPLNPIVANTTNERSLSLPLINFPREQNVFDLGGSNFVHLLEGRTTIVEQVLTFPNDSMRLGASNKQLVEQLVTRFNPRTDVFSVIGCSMGPTQVRGGNAALALGRAGRVVEALRFAGVANELILDEGCWAGDGSIDNLPRRGVVVSLNRDA